MTKAQDPDTENTLGAFKLHQIGMPTRQPITVIDEVRRLRMIQRELDPIGTSIQRITLKEARDWLANGRLRGWTDHQYNNRAKALNAWFAYRDHLEDKSPIPIIQTMQEEYRALSDEEVSAIRAMLHLYAPGADMICASCTLDKRAAPTQRHRYLNECRRCYRRMEPACATCGQPSRGHNTETEVVITAFCIGVGIRPEEVSRLDRGDYDRSSRRLFIRRPAKKGKKRRIPIPTWVCDAIDAYLPVRPQPKGPDAQALIVSEKRGIRRMHPVSLTRVATRTAKKAGIHVNFNIGRHTVATQLLRAGLDIRYVQYYLGHINIRNTARYAEVRFEDVESRYRAILNDNATHTKETT